MKVVLFNKGHGRANLGWFELKTKEKREVDVTPEQYELLRATGGPAGVRVTKGKEA